ncbi:unnamed protein product [Enterobius vermicularis]|uniref:Uncharacterized protein n=1 Tax=Enterobius vermicularis TaxID=51028 RepID=A0A0N4VQ24_ENTVE|nr:unnamed protein product [Enterobius vermicularis]
MLVNESVSVCAGPCDCVVFGEQGRLWRVCGLGQFIFTCITPDGCPSPFFTGDIRDLVCPLFFSLLLLSLSLSLSQPFLCVAPCTLWSHQLGDRIRAADPTNWKVRGLDERMREVRATRTAGD